MPPCELLTVHSASHASYRSFRIFCPAPSAGLSTPCWTPEVDCFGRGDDDDRVVRGADCGFVAVDDFGAGADAVPVEIEGPGFIISTLLSQNALACSSAERMYM